MPDARPVRRNAEAWFIWAAVAYAAGFVIHDADHVRRGFDSLTTAVLVLGSGAGVVQLGALILAFTHHRLAPLVAVAVGFPDAVGITAVHLLPHWSSLSDAFPGSHGVGVTGLSWVAAITEIVGALTFGIAGAAVLRQRGGVRALAATPIAA